MGAHRRLDQRTAHVNLRDTFTSSDLPSSIANPGAPSSVAGIVTATEAPTAYTTVVNTNTGLGPNGQPTTVLATYTVYDPAVYSSLESAGTTTTVRTTSHAPSTTTASSAKSTGSTSAKSSPNLSTLIPAIVVPVAAVLLASFVFFWFFMRRRHRRELKTTNFVMAGKGEKLHSNAPSTRSTHSQEGASPISAPAKPVTTVTTSEFAHSAGSPPPSYRAEDIGVARALTSQDQKLPAGRSPIPPRTDSAAGSHIIQAISPRNFNSPRPSTAGQQSTYPPNRSGQVQTRDRSRSQPGRGSPARDFRGSPSPQMQGRSDQRSARTQPRGPPPNSRHNSTLDTYTRGDPTSPPGQSRAFGLPRSPSNGPRPNPRAHSPNPTPAVPPHTGKLKPAPILPPPVGAFNGVVGSISQYSPIVKETPYRNKGLGLNTTGLTKGPQSGMESGSSSAGGFALGLSDENMRIARLGAGMAPSPVSRSPGVGAKPTFLKEHDRDVSRDGLDFDFGSFGANQDKKSEEAGDTRSEVSSLHEMERFDFDNWEGDGRSTRRVSEEEPDVEGGARARGLLPISAHHRERDSFSLDVR